MEISLLFISGFDPNIVKPLMDIQLCKVLAQSWEMSSEMSRSEFQLLTVMELS